MTFKPIIGIAAAGLAVFAAAWGLSPVLAAHGLVLAAEAGDVAGIERRVDFPAFRNSLKTELNAELVARMRDDPRVSERGLGSLGMMLAPMLLSGAVDALVTPEVVAEMVKTARAPDPARGEQPEATTQAKDDIHQAWGYRGMDAFAVTLTDPDRPDDHLALILERRGLFEWKLAAVDIETARDPSP